MMLNKILITGGIGTGKSTVLNIFKSQLPDYNFNDMDNIVNSLYNQKDTEFSVFLSNNFGTTSKEQISKIVFSDKKKMEQLNTYLYYVVDNYLSEWMNDTRNEVLEFPLFFEMLEKAQSLSFNENVCYNILKNATIVVIRADQDIRIERILSRSKVTHPDWDYSTVLNILKNQLDSEIKEKQASFIVDNSGTLNDTTERIKTICEKIKMEKLYA
jgi:dephospho-CoA kinase